MDARVFEPLSVKLFRREKELVFEDSGCSLYRFLDGDGLPGSAKHSDDVENVTPVKRNEKKKRSSRSVRSQNVMSLFLSHLVVQ